MRSNRKSGTWFGTVLLCLLLGVLPTLERLRAQGGHSIPTAQQAPPRDQAPGQKSPPNSTPGPPNWRTGP